MPYKIDEIMAIADKYGIPIVEDAAVGMGSRFNGQVLGTFGKYGVLSFNGNKMITTSGGGALVCRNAEDANEVMWYAHRLVMPIHTTSTLPSATTTECPMSVRVSAVVR